MTTVIESADRPLSSGVAGEDVDVGELTTYIAGTGVMRATFSDDVTGVAEGPRTADHIVEDELATGGDTYLASENDRVPYGGNSGGDVIHLLTLEDSGDGHSAPTIGHGDVVGIIDDSAEDAPTDGYQGRVVQEGYAISTDIDGDADGTTTTFNRENGNFKPIGIAHKDSASSWDESVRVTRGTDL